MAKDGTTESSRKKAKVEEKRTMDRPITPPLSANTTPTSSIYSTRRSTRSTTFSDPSPVGSSRSTSSSSSSSTLCSFNDSKPYAFDASSSLPFTTSPLTPVCSTAGSFAGVKRANDTVDYSSNTRQKLDASAIEDQLPIWSTPVYADPYYSHDLYPPSLPEAVESIVWTANAPLPEYLPHMTSTPRNIPAFTLPDQHAFAFSVPTSQLRHTA